MYEQLFDLKVDRTHRWYMPLLLRKSCAQTWRTMEKSCWGILIMDESVSETFPNDVIARVNFVSELFSFFSGSARTGCESQRELGYSQSLCALLLCLYGTLWCCRADHDQIKCYSQTHSTSALSLLIQHSSVFVSECLCSTWWRQQPLQSKYWLL